MADDILPQKETTTSPDPSRLTVDMLVRELASLQAMLEARMDGSDKRIELIQHILDGRGEAIRQEVEHLKDLHQERFKRVETQILERDQRVEQTSRDVKSAVDMALSAAKEAVGEQNKSNALSISKSEAGFTKQIDQIQVLIATQAKGIEDKIDDLKLRITQFEGRSQGLGTAWGFLAGFVGLVVAIVALALKLK